MIAKRVCLALSLALIAGGSASADWLVTKDGARVETKGSWEVKGKRVIFTLPNGVLSSMRLDDVDLEASEELAIEIAEAERQAAEEAAAPKEEPVQKEAVWVITDKDIPKAASAQAEQVSGDPENPGAAPQPAASQSGSEVSVATWAVNEEAIGGLEIRGELVNPTGDLATSITLAVRLFDAQGTEIANRYARLDEGSLVPGQTTAWSVMFPDLFEFSSVRFTPQSQRFKTEEIGVEDAGSPDGG